MSKPMPNRPQTRMRLTVFGGAARYGRTKGTAIRAIAVSVSTRNGGLPLLAMARRSLSPAHAEQSLRSQQQHHGHRREEHDVGIAGVDHRRDADELPGDQSSDPRTRERTDAADD